MSDTLLPTAPSMDEPLEILEACHGRIEAQLKTLEKLCPHLQKHGADSQAVAAAQRVLHYFDTAGQHHHEDEEANLFPLLRARVSHDSAHPLPLLIEQLRQDHRAMSAAWQRVREQLTGIATDSSPVLDMERVQTLATLYRQHIVKENTALLPEARKLLSKTDIEQLSEAMVGRRSHPTPTFPSA